MASESCFLHLYVMYPSVAKMIRVRSVLSRPGESWEMPARCDHSFSSQNFPSSVILLSAFKASTFP